MTHYITGRNSETFLNLDEAIKYADKWNDKSITVYENGRYSSTIHKEEVWPTIFEFHLKQAKKSASWSTNL